MDLPHSYLIKSAWGNVYVKTVLPDNDAFWQNVNIAFTTNNDMYFEYRAILLRQFGLITCQKFKGLHFSYITPI